MGKKILPYLVLGCFLSIRISNYNNRDSFSLFEAFFYVIRDYENWNFSCLFNNLFYTVLEFFVLCFCIVSSLLLNKPILKLISLVLFYAYWGLIFFSYSGLMDTGFFLLSSIPFMIFNGVWIWWLCLSRSRI